MSEREGLFEILEEWVWIFAGLYDIFNCWLLPGFLLGSAWVSLSPEQRSHDSFGLRAMRLPPGCLQGACASNLLSHWKGNLNLSLLALRNFPFPFLWCSLVIDIILWTESLRLHLLQEEWRVLLFAEIWHFIPWLFSLADHALITWMNIQWSHDWSCTDHEPDHALITWLNMHWSGSWSYTDHMTLHAMITWLILHWSLGWSYTDHVADHAVITVRIMH